MKNLILFDVDGTIAESSKKVNDGILIYLEIQKNQNIDYGLISGGKFDKICDQVGERFIKSNKPLFKYVFPENGMIGFNNSDKFFEKKLIDVFNENQLNEIEKIILNNSNNYLLSNNLNKIDRRTTMWYFTPVGVNCNDQIRETFIKEDTKKNIRIEIIKILSPILQKLKLTIKLGGSIGLAIYPNDWDKSYIIKNRIIDIDLYESIYFFGDKCFHHGNDYTLYNCPEIKGISVKDPLDTFNKLNELIEKLNSNNLS